jgi:vibriolysin
MRVTTSQADEALTFKINAELAGGEHIRRSQTFQGLRVYGGEIVTHHEKPQSTTAKIARVFGKQAEIVGVSGAVVANPYVASTVPNLTEQQAFDLAIAELEHVLVVEDKTIELLVFPFNGKNHLAYQVSFFAETEAKPTRPIFFIDAHTGAILNMSESLSHAEGFGPGGNSKIGQYYFGTDKPAFNVTELGNGRCAMAAKDIRVIDMQHGVVNSNTFEFPCHENSHKAINGAYSPLNDAAYYGQATLEMFNNWYNTKALTHDLVMRVHYRQDYLNAFWNGSSVTFGDGDKRIHPFTSLGVIAHEVAHGVTHQNSKLVYEGQSGGVNESFSDMTSEALECFLNQNADGSCTVDWKIGHRIFVNRDAMRYMDKPSRDGASLDHASQYKVGVGVHYSSGVFNRAFYLLATSPNWGVKKAYEVMLHANKHFWTYNGNFESLACGVTSAAKSLGYDTQAIGDAFNQVGVFACAGNKAPTITLTNLSDNTRVALGTSLTWAADAKDDDGQVISVEYFVNGQSIAKETQSPYRVTWQASSVGKFVVSAIATDNEGATTPSASNTITVVDAGQCTTPEWNNDAVYQKGARVSQLGYEYTAKWWNRGANPESNSGQWDVWQRGLECGKSEANQAPTLTFVTPVDGQSVDMDAIVAVRFNAADRDGSMRSIRVFDNGVKLTELSSAPWQFNYTAKREGQTVLTAVAVDDKGATSLEAKVKFDVKAKAPIPTNSAPTVRIAAAGNTQIYVGESIAFNAAVEDKDNDASLVEWMVNGTRVTQSKAPFGASLTFTQAGTFTVQAIAHDATGLTGNSETINVVVSNKPEPTTCKTPTWNAQSVYLAGHKVSVNGVLYQAKWWTRNQHPEQNSSTWAVWKSLGKCGS